ncbi:MAG TPA: hypothetical protein VF999_00545 [Thermoanaerobaculia bacterium]
MWNWKVRILPSDEGSFEYKATFSLSGAEGDGDVSEREVLEPKYLYGQGDLAVFLEDLGAGAGAIGVLLDELNDRPNAEIIVEIGDEALELLWPGRAQPF